jgi:hypothetical protein
MEVMMQTTICLILSAILIYFIWQETGWATATAIGLITVGNELQSFMIRNLTTSVKFILGR